MKSVSRSKQSQARLSDRIRIARRNAKLSQGGLAKLLGVTPGAVAQWESAAGTTPSVFRLVEIATATRVSFAWLGTGRSDARRGAGIAEEVSALNIASYARDLAEEELLECFRSLPANAQASMSEFLSSMTSHRR